jgi:hypothetical protein
MGCSKTPEWFMKHKHNQKQKNFLKIFIVTPRDITALRADVSFCMCLCFHGT